MLRITWKEGPAPTHEYAYHTAGVYDGKIYITGGINHGAFEVLDPRTGTWTELDRLPVPRSFAAGVVMDSMFYVAGGLDSTDTSTALVEAYNFNKAKWQSCPPMLNARSRFTLVSTGEKLYAIGGLEVDPEGTYANLSSIECFDPAVGEWTILTGMKVPRHGHSALVVNDKILIAGGYTVTGHTGLTELYDPATQKWEILEPMPTPRGFFGMVCLDQKVLTLAGRVYSGESPVEQFDIATRTWKVLEPFPGAGNRFACAVLDQTIYMIGGEETPRRVLIGLPGS